MTQWSRTEGTPHPLGARWIEDERAWNFALYARHAHSVTLLLYDAESAHAPVREVTLDPLRHKSGSVWHIRLGEHEAGAACRYAYRVDGPDERMPPRWHAFDPEKVLLDPAARAVSFPTDFDRAAAREPGDNSGRAPLGELVRDRPDEGAGVKRHEGGAVIYELHVRGFTRDPSSGLAETQRGTYEGLTQMIPYLRDLGVNVIELMPVTQKDPTENNFWGYNPLSFFAPHRQYATEAAQRDGTPRDEFRRMVEAFHEADMEVVVDMVLNHTCELGLDGPVYSFKGIDAPSHYLFSGNPKDPYRDLTGVANTFRCVGRAGRSLIVEALRAWVTELGIDGFRFDLATIFSRGDDGRLLEEPPLMAQIESDPVLRSCRLIAEPWDAAGGHQLGCGFPGQQWAQWNDTFRDDLRRFVRGDPGRVAPLMTRLYGSDDYFPDKRPHACRPYQSVNFVTCHDGFTLHDLVSYNKKHNWANGHGNQDGAGENLSWNHGFEGESGVPHEVQALRRQQAKNFLALLLLANGTPMLRAGDEFLETTGGNNNPYNQDNPTGWINWRRLEPHREIHRFVKGMIAFRKAHPGLARSRYWRDDVTWHGPSGPADLTRGSRTLAFLLDNRAEDDTPLLVLAHAGAQALGHVLPEPPTGRWHRVVDTARPSPEDLLEPGAERPVGAHRYELQGRSVVVLLAR